MLRTDRIGVRRRKVRCAIVGPSGETIFSGTTDDLKRAAIDVKRGNRKALLDEVDDLAADLGGGAAVKSGAGEPTGAGPATERTDVLG